MIAIWKDNKTPPVTQIVWPDDKHRFCVAFVHDDGRIGNVLCYLATAESASNKAMEWNALPKFGGVVKVIERTDDKAA